jgi:hypothetical protein
MWLSIREDSNNLLGIHLWPGKVTPIFRSTWRCCAHCSRTRSRDDGRGSEHGLMLISTKQHIGQVLHCLMLLIHVCKWICCFALGYDILLLCLAWTTSKGLKKKPWILTCLSYLSYQSYCNIIDLSTKFCGARTWTNGLVYTKHILYHWTTSPAQGAWFLNWWYMV